MNEHKAVASISATQFLTSHADDISLGIAAVVIVLALTELIKPWAKLGIAKLSLSEKMDASILRSLSFVICVVPVLVLDFRSSWSRMTGSDELLDWPSAILIGCSMTWAGVQLSWLLFSDMKPVKVLRVWLYKRLGVTDDEISQARSRTPMQSEDDGGELGRDDNSGA